MRSHSLNLYILIIVMNWMDVFIAIQINEESLNQFMKNEASAWYELNVLEGRSQSRTMPIEFLACIDRNHRVKSHPCISLSLCSQGRRFNEEANQRRKGKALSMNCGIRVSHVHHPYDTRKSAG